MPRIRRSLFALIVLIGIGVGYVAEERVSAYCWYGGDCLTSPPGGTCGGDHCGQIKQMDAYYDPSCGSVYCCSGFYWCMDYYPPDFECLTCGSTNHSYCGIC